MAVIGSVILFFNDDGSVTCGGVEHASAVEAVKAAMPGATVVDNGPGDPWAPRDTGPWPGGAQPAATASAPVQTYAAPSAVPSCVHGPLKIVPGGFSQRTQKAYTAFWSCPAPSGQQCRLDRKTLPPVPA